MSEKIPRALLVLRYLLLPSRLAGDSEMPGR